jgi:hypothetical protein
MAVNNLIILRKGTASQWNSANPVLASGEPGYDLTNLILKIGDGVTAWNSLSNHNHTVSNISDFNSSVSGLFPVKNIVAGSNVTISSTSGTYTINSTATGGSSTSVSNYGSNRVLLSDNTSTGINAQTNLTFDGATLTAPSGSFSSSLKVNSVNVSVSGHNHIIGDVTGLQSALDGKQASGSYAASSHTHTSSQITDFNTSVSGLVNGVYAPLASPTFTGTVNGITKSMVGLGNVDNTSDTSKPISSATQTALDNKAALSHTHTSSNITDFNSSVSGLVSNYALLNSPTLTGTPLSPTAAVDTNTTQIASTAFVLGQASSSTPLIDGTATIGTSTRYARADHIHPTDTTRAALTGATFTGSISSPSGNFTQSLQVNSTGVSLVGHTHTSSQISDSTTAGRALLTGADAAAQRTSLGLGTLATQNGTFSGTSSGTNTGDQTISISGDVTASGSSSSLNATVTKINGVLLAGLSTGLIKNTTSTGAPSIAIAGTDYAAASHTHTSSNITDFNSSVSGLLPVLNIVAGSGVTISATSGTYTLNATGSSSIPTNVTNSANLYLWSSFR